MLAPILNLIESIKCKQGFGRTRTWNRTDFKIFHSNFYNNRDAKTYIEQMRDSVIETMVQFVNYKESEFIEQTLNNIDTELFTFFHNRTDEKGRKFEGVTLSFSVEVSKDRFDKIDLIFEDMAVNKKFDGEVNQVRLYISPLSRYARNDYDLLYWDASDRRSLDVFQTAYLDNIIFFKQDRKKRVWKKWQHKYLDQFKKREVLLKGSSFPL